MNRSAYQCHKTNCDSQALHTLRMHFHTLSRDIDFTCDSSIKTCDRHRRQAEEYVLSPQNKTAISMKFMFEGLPPPDFSSTRFIWRPVIEGVAMEGAA